MAEKEKSQNNYKGFVAGVFSGVAKLSGELLYPSTLFWEYRAGSEES